MLYFNHQQGYISVTNPCQDSRCSQLCLPVVSETKKYTCKCTAGYKLNKNDGVTCEGMYYIYLTSILFANIYDRYMKLEDIDKAKRIGQQVGPILSPLPWP